MFTSFICVCVNNSISYHFGASFPLNFSLQLSACSLVNRLNNGTGCLISVERLVSERKVSLKGFSFKYFPRVTSCGVGFNPSKKLILAAVDGIYGSIKNDWNRMKLAITFKTRWVLYRFISTFRFHGFPSPRIWSPEDICYLLKKPTC